MMMDTNFLFYMKADSEASLIKMGKSKPQGIKFCYDTFFWYCGDGKYAFATTVETKECV